MTAILIITALLILVLSILMGYNLYQGGKEIKNNRVSNAGLQWLIIIALSLIIAIVSYVNMNNALKESISTKSQGIEKVKTYRGLKSNVK